MFNLAANTVAIHRLILRARPGQQAAADALRYHLQNAEWTETGGDSWVFIRRVQVSGSSRQLPLQLLQQTRQYLKQTNNADEVVRFANLTELLAALLGDLARGKANACWYWQRWAHLFTLPAARAAQSLLSEHLTLLPSVSARLAQQGYLQTVWLVLDETGSRQLAAELANLNGFRLPPVRDVMATLAGQIDRMAHGNTLSVALSPLTVQHYLPAALVIRWQSALQNLDMSDDRFLLALILIGQEAVPLLLQQQPVQLLAALSGFFAALQADLPRSLDRATVLQRLAAYVPVKAPVTPVSAETQESQRISASARDDLPQPGKNSLLPNDVSAINAPEPADSRRRNAEAETRQTGHLTADAAAAIEGADQLAVIKELPESALPLHKQPAEPVFSSFNTTQGGLLYLLNVLNRSEMRALMLQHAEQLPSGWAWLYRLGQELQLCEDDGLVDFIALHAGLENRSGLLHLPVLPARDQVLNLVQRWYGKTEVWQADLLRLPAEIRYSPSHVDMYAAMATIRLPVRMAGLDINPGWLPWLGKVVNFHYD